MPDYYDGDVPTFVKQRLIADELQEAGVDAWRIGHIMTAIKYIDRMGLKDGEPVEKDAHKAADYMMMAMDGRWLREG